MIEFVLGTIICAVITSSAIFVGVDGRKCKKVKDENSEEEILLLSVDDCKKFFEISPGLAITGTGNYARFRLICGFWESFPEGFVIAFDEAKFLMETFCMGKRMDLPMGEDGMPVDMTKKSDSDCCTILLVGKSKIYQDFVICKMCDNKETEVYTQGICFIDSFTAFGGGSRFAVQKWDSYNEYNGMEEEVEITTKEELHDEITLRIINSLVEASIHHPGCGGDIKVHKVEEKSITKLESRHLIDLMIKLEIPMKKSELLFFSRNPYKDVNYQSLILHFEDDYNYDLASIPKCLGYVVPGQWTCFVVNLIDIEENDKSDEYFEKCAPLKIGDKELDQEVHRHNLIGGFPVWVTRGHGHTVLKDAREGKFLP